MKRIKVIRQLQPNECGLCCCKMVLDFHDCNVQLRDIRNEIGSIRDGVNIFHIKKYIEKYNFKARVLKLKTSDVSDTLKKLKLPAILFWDNRHFVVLEGIKNNRYSIIDPELGRVSYAEKDILAHFNNILLEVHQLEDSLKISDIGFFKKWYFFIFSLKSSAGKIVLSVVLSIFMYLITIFSAEFSKIIINRMSGLTNPTNLEQHIGTFNDFLIVLLLFFVVVGAAVFIREIISLSLRVDTEKKIVSEAFKKTLSLPYSFFESRTNGELMTSLGSVNLLKDFLLDKYIKMFFDIGLFIILIGYVCSISVKLFFIHIVLLVLNQALIISLSNKIKELGHQEFTLNSQSNGIQIETLHSIQLTKVMRSENEIYSKWENIFSELQNIRKRKQFYQGILATFGNTVNIIIPLLLLVVGFYLFIHQEVTLGDIIIAQTFTIMSISLIAQVLNTYSEYIVNSSFIERINDIVLHPEEIQGVREIDKIKKIEIKNLDFTYSKDANLVLKNINLCINSGEKIAFVGSTGCGKSTLVKLLSGLYREENLPIFYNDVPANEIAAVSLSKQISCVLQDMHIYADTILENIRAQRHGYNEADVKKAAEAACLDQDVSKFPMQYYTVPTDSGMDLSGGQKQRIAIARAVLNNPTVLIFDEGTSYLDYTTERKIMNNILGQENISIIVAHRLDSIKNCDRIYFMENGEIVEQGTHYELMDLKGKYYDLYSN